MKYRSTLELLFLVCTFCRKEMLFSLARFQIDVTQCLPPCVCMCASFAMWVIYLFIFGINLSLSVILCVRECQIVLEREGGLCANAPFNANRIESCFFFF